MKVDATECRDQPGGPTPSRVAPVLHASSSEPEYDAAEVCRRAGKITKVLSEILQDHPPIITVSSATGPGPTAPPPG